MSKKREQQEQETKSDAERGMTELQSELEKAEKERDQNYEQLQRALADLQNFRRRRVQEMEEARHGAFESLVHELLPVLDNFHLALEAIEQAKASPDDVAGQAHAMDEGVRMVHGLLLGVLERRGLQEVHGGVGDMFDHERHEAVGIDPTSEHESGKISQVVQRGYAVGERVVRHTRVLVSGESAPQSGPDDEGGSE